MATRSGGVSGVVFGLVTFVFLFVICLVLAILFYTQRNAALEKAEEATETQEQFVRSGDEDDDLFIAASERSGPRSVASQLMAEYRQMVNYLVGDPNTPRRQVNRELADVGVLSETGEGEDATFALQSNAVARINAALSRADSAEQSMAELEQAQQRREAEVQRLQQELEAQQQRHPDALATLRDRLEARNQQFEQFEASAEAAREELIAKHEQFREQAQQREDELREQIAGLEQELAKRDALVAELRRVVRANQLSGPDMTLEADGEVLETNPGEGTVVINLGRQDKLILGMTFAVFDEETGVVTEVERDGRTVHMDEKAVIEVTRFGEDGKTAVARVVKQTFGEPISSGDIISNIVYDRNRQFDFFVYGDFDLDGDNRATSTERERIRNMIRTWGGRVIQQEQLPVDADFVVLGEAPEFPKQPAPDAPEEEWIKFEEQKTAYRRYNEVLGLAQDLGIPILNQNRFLTLVGFFGN